MKSLFVVLSLIVISLSTFAQTTIKKVAFNRRDNGLSSIRYDCTFQTKDGMGKPDSVIVTVDNELIDSLHFSDSLINSMIHSADFDAKYSLKEKISYQIDHSENVMLFMGKDYKTHKPQINMIWYYIGQNAYGAKRSNRLYASYDMQGNYLDHSIGN
jgi:hypothetical protein